MGQAQRRDTLPAPESVGAGWRAFQFAGMLTAVSWLVSYFVFLNGYEALITVFGFSHPLSILGGISYFLSPIISVVLLLIAVKPEALSVLHGSDAKAVVSRSLLFLLPTVWLATVFLGPRMMVDQMMAHPLGHSVALPMFGGAFFHVVFQHWLQGFTAIVLALVPNRFATLTEAENPAGTGYLVRDVTEQMEVEQRLQRLHEATRAMMRADRPGEVATIASDAATDVLGISHTRVHLRDDRADGEELVPAAWSDGAEAVHDGEPPTVDADSGLVWESYRDGDVSHYPTVGAVDADAGDVSDSDGDADAETPLESSLLLPLGEHGIMLAQSTEPAAFSDANVELAHLLSANTRAALAQTERARELELVRALLDRSSEGVFVVDPTTREIRDANDPACTQIDYTREELLSSTLEDVVASLSGGTTVEEAIEAARDRGRVTLSGETRHRDGSTVPVELSLTHLDLDREYLVAMARDVTERRERRQEYAATNAELELLGFVQRLVDDVVARVLDPTPRGDVELSACETLQGSPFYEDAWLVDPGVDPSGDPSGDPSVDPSVDPSGDVATSGFEEGTADGGMLRTIDDMDAGSPTTAAIAETVTTDTTNILVGAGDPVSSETGSPAPDTRSVPDDETGISVPLTFEDVTYGALVVTTDREDPFGAHERAALETLATALAVAVHARTRPESTPDGSVVELEFVAPASTALASRVANALGCPVGLEGLVPQDDETITHYYVADIDCDGNGELEGLRKRVEAVEAVESCRVIDRDDELVLEVRGSGTDVLDRVAAAGAVARTARAEPEDGDGDRETQLVVDLPPGTDRQAIARIVRESDARWTLADQRQVDRPIQRMQAAAATLADSLTDKQREALLTAYFTGYYDHPRTGTADEVADALAITNSTLYQHLQAAQRKLIEAWVEPTGEAAGAKGG